MSHLLDFTHRTHEVVTTEQLPGTGTKFTANYIFIQTVVTVDLDFIDGGLSAFVNSHFKVDRISIDIDFNRVEVIEQVAVVIV